MFLGSRRPRDELHLKSTCKCLLCKIHDAYRAEGILSSVSGWDRVLTFSCARCPGLGSATDVSLHIVLSMEERFYLMIQKVFFFWHVPPTVIR